MVCLSLTKYATAASFQIFTYSNCSFLMWNESNGVVLGSSTVSAACDSSVAGSGCVFVIRNSMGQSYRLTDTHPVGIGFL